MPICLSNSIFASRAIILGMRPWAFEKLRIYNHSSYAIFNQSHLSPKPISAGKYPSPLRPLKHPRMKQSGFFE